MFDQDGLPVVSIRCEFCGKWVEAGTEDIISRRTRQQAHSALAVCATCRRAFTDKDIIWHVQEFKRAYRLTPRAKAILDKV